MRNTIAYSIIGFLVVLVIGLTGYSSSISRQNAVTATMTISGLTSTTTQTITVTVSSSTGSSNTHVWTSFFNVSGAGDKNSNTFTVSGDMRLMWAYNTTSPQYASLAIYLYHVGDSIFSDSVRSGPGQTSDTAFLYLPPGQYYLKVLAANIDGWKIDLAQ